MGQLASSERGVRFVPAQSSNALLKTESEAKACTFLYQSYEFTVFTLSLKKDLKLIWDFFFLEIFCPVDLTKEFFLPYIIKSPFLYSK